MAQVINAGMASAGDLKTLGVKQGATLNVVKGGQTVAQPLSNVEQQRLLVNQICRDTRRSTQKYITAKFSSSGDAKKFVLGNTFGLSSDVKAAEVTATYQNSGTVPATAWANFINCTPFRYVGVKVEVSASSIFNNNFTEIVNDVDANQTYPFNDKLDAGQNTFSTEPTVRLLNIAGEFNGCWGLYSTLDTDQWIKFSFNCVEIQRGW